MSRQSFSSQVRKELLSIVGGQTRKVYVRKCFLAGGTVTDPVKSYHMAFTLTNTESQKLIKYLTGFGLSPKVITKNDKSIVYLKEADEISDTLRIMGANKSLLAYESKRVEKELRNALNRHVNCEAANLNKIVTAAQYQIDAIQFIANETGLSGLSKPLQEVAKLRLLHETASLTEIGQMLTPPIGKSGVNHRLRKICETAEDIKRFK